MPTKEELKKEYKLNPPKMGIFRITNTVNGKIYLVATKNLPAAYNRFPFSLKGGNYFIRDLQKEWNEFGEAAFKFDELDVLEFREDPNYDYTDDLEELLQLWLEKLQPYGDKGYHTKKE
jgi:hypothetical protein